LEANVIFTPTQLRDAYIVDIEKREDHRGLFARAWCQREFAEHDLVSRLVQTNLSFNWRKGTLRGMHYQVAPYEETKLIRCVRGAIYDVIIDLRPASPTFGQWLGVELTADNYRTVYVPEGFAHGFQTLEDNSVVTYQVSEFYESSAERGIRYNDPAFAIRWPIEVEVISDKDRSWPDYSPEFHVTSGEGPSNGDSRHDDHR
jgi:dTDP-4-dehydrorhamnose 3,5-epimerase